MKRAESAHPLGATSDAKVGATDRERAAFEEWLNPGGFAGNVSPWISPGRYEKETHQMAWLGWKYGRSAERKQLADACWERRGHFASDAAARAFADLVLDGLA